MSASPSAWRPRRLRLRDPKLWIGLVITGVTVWLAVRGVSFEDLARDLREANVLVLVAYSVPGYVGALYLRALRWRHLTDAVQPISRGPLFRATAVGFMVNNLVPLRVGEVVRAWMLAREVGASGAAILGTVILERVIDAVFVSSLALAVLGSQSGGVALAGPLLAAVAVPVSAVIALRVAPEQVVGLAGRTLLWALPERAVLWVQRLLRSFAEGLGSLRGGRHLFWIALHSVLIWGVFSVIPIYGALQALHVDLGSTSRQLSASYATLAAVGVAVALPSAPGFFGPYHYAARLALTRFGLPQATALAVGTLAHATFWVTVTLLGLAVLRFRHASLDETLEAAAEPAGKDPPAERR
ncbi:MAG: lysylphosphatidylglycerol synthase transmembrane domain-containing protein [Myxococcota bacterium]